MRTPSISDAILVVDDDADSRELLSSISGSRGWLVHIVVNT
jgi:CheY-like chemotaxis protein